MSYSHPSVDTLEKQLADLQMTKDVQIQGKLKKIPPAVPPKKKAQPQVPHSSTVNSLREPSFSTKISPIFNNNLLRYHNYDSGQSNHDYANVSNLNTTFTQAHGQNFVKSPTLSSSHSSSTLNRNISPPPPPPPPPLTLNYVPSQTNECCDDVLLPPPSPVSSNYSELAQATANLNFNQDAPTFGRTYQNEYLAYGVNHAPISESFYEPISPRSQTNLSLYSSNSKSNTRIGFNKSPLPKEEEVDALTNLLVQSISDCQDLDIFGICVKCNEKVVGEHSGCTAMGKMYHVKCFCCFHCNINLQGKPFYAVDGQPYCETDYYETLEKCSVCNKPILDRILRATGKPYHPACFTCVACGKSLDGIPFTVDAMNQIHCIEDFHKKFAPRCCVCELPIMPEDGEEETVRVVALDRSFHVHCYRCESCGMLLSSEAEGRGCYPLDNHILCKSCNAHRIRMLTNECYDNKNVMTTDL